jgi:hypothetical protein
LLAVAAGFCVFDPGHNGTDNHARPADLCAGMLALALGLVPVVGPLVADGKFLSDPFRPAYAASLSLPDPPPKPSLS